MSAAIQEKNSKSFDVAEGSVMTASVADHDVETQGVKLDMRLEALRRGNSAETPIVIWKNSGLMEGSARTARVADQI